MSKVLVRPLALALAILALAAALIEWVAFGTLAAPVPRAIGAAPAELQAVDVSFPSTSGTTIHGWLSQDAAGHGAVLLLPGVRADRRNMLSRAEFLHRLGFSVLLIDFQATGESRGKRITFGDLESRDVTAALDYLHHTLPHERLGIIGVSVGAAAFVLARGRPRVDAVVLESMYPTLRQAIADRLRVHFGAWSVALTPLICWQFKRRLAIDPERLRPIDRIGQIYAPLLLIHGTRDEHTTLAEARAEFAAAAQPKQFWAVEGAAHSNFHGYAKPQYEERVGRFLTRCLVQPPA